MGRELQKKKNRSSIPKKRQNPKSKKKILQNPIIAANWYSLFSPLSTHKRPLIKPGHKEPLSVKIINASASPQNSTPPPAAKKNLQ
jgi:hypothetical protein